MECKYCQKEIEHGTECGWYHVGTMRHLCELETGIYTGFMAEPEDEDDKM